MFNFEIFVSSAENDIQREHRRSSDFWLGGGANHKLHATTSSETSKQEFFGGQRYRKMEDQKPWPGVGT